MDKYASEFYKTIKKLSPSVGEINDHFNTEAINKIDIFKEIVGNFFYGFLPFPLILRIFMVFINEGFSIFYRFYYAMLKLTKTEIRDITNTKGVIRMMRKKLLNCLHDEENVRTFFKHAYDLKLPCGSMKNMHLNKEERLGNVSYYLPNIYGSS